MAFLDKHRVLHDDGCMKDLKKNFDDSMNRAMEPDSRDIRITELEKQLANSVPWVLFKNRCECRRKVYGDCNYGGDIYECTTKQNCPLINPEQEEVTE